MTTDRRGRRNRLSFGAAIAIVTAIATTPAPAEAQRFIEVSRQRLSIKGDFDDSILLRSASLSVNVPALETANGLGITVGSRKGPLLVGFRYVRTNPRATSVLGDTVAAHRAYGADLSLAPLVGRGTFRAGPLLRVGSAFTTIGLPGQATSGSETGDARFASVSLQVGAGVLVHVRTLHVSVDVSRHYLKFGGATGLGESVSTRNGVSGTGNVLSVRLGAYLPG